MNLSIYESVTNSILTALRRGVVPWRKPWQGDDALPSSAISTKPYRGVNVFLLSMTPFADHRWLTSKQLIERGGQAKADQKPTTVVFWKRWQPPVDQETGELGRAPIPVLRYFKVFNLEQCENHGFPPAYVSPDRELQRIARAELIVSEMADPPKVTEGKSAWYRPSDDVVQIPPIARFRSPESYYSTLFHELGHATGHERRLNRSGVTGSIRFGSGEYSKEELVAELTSAFCCASAGLDTSILENAASYIDGWLKVLQSDPKAVVIAAAQAQRAADYIKGVTYAS